MASTNTGWVGRFSPMDHLPPASYKLDRLRELRAVINSLRDERASRDPLYAWIIERERAENRRHD